MFFDVRIRAKTDSLFFKFKVADFASSTSDVGKQIATFAGLFSVLQGFLSHEYQNAFI